MIRISRAAALTLAAAVLACGCGSVSGHAASPASRAVPQSLATSVAIGPAAWAVIPMGASSGANLFWQLFVLRAGGRWTLETPPDIATNGAIALADAGGLSVVAGVRPSIDLTFAPITSTANGGGSWAAGPPARALADVPDALTIAPGGSQLLALYSGGRADQASRTGTRWTTLTTQRLLAAAPAARACGLTGITAVAYSPSGLPLLGGSCGRPGQAGVFTDNAGRWQASGPRLPSALAGQRTRLLRLTRTGNGDVALLQAGTGLSAVLLAAWTTGTGTWALSPAYALRGRAVAAASFASSGAAGVVLTGRRAITVTGPGSSWQPLPALPAGKTVTLALPAAAELEALAADGSTLTVWQLASGATGWLKAQVVRVPIQYGSSS